MWSRKGWGGIKLETAAKISPNQLSAGGPFSLANLPVVIASLFLGKRALVRAQVHWGLRSQRIGRVHRRTLRKSVALFARQS